jgi:hypothetical protein
MSYTLCYTELKKTSASAYLFYFNIDNRIDFLTWLPFSNTTILEEKNHIIISDWLFKKLAQKVLPGNNGTFYREIERFVISKDDLQYIKLLTDDDIDSLIAL